jgi:hypothetical protein
MCIPLSLLGKGSVKRYRYKEYTTNNRIIVGRVVFYAVRVVSKKRRRFFTEIFIYAYLSIYLWLYSPCGRWPHFQFLNLYTVCRTPTGISPSQGRYLHTEQHKQNKCTQTFMPRVGFEATIPVFDRAKRVHALDRAVAVIGLVYS